MDFYEPLHHKEDAGPSDFSQRVRQVSSFFEPQARPVIGRVLQALLWPFTVLLFLYLRLVRPDFYLAARTTNLSVNGHHSEAVEVGLRACNQYTGRLEQPEILHHFWEAGAWLTTSAWELNDLEIWRAVIAAVYPYQHLADGYQASRTCSNVARFHESQDQLQEALTWAEVAHNADPYFPYPAYLLILLQSRCNQIGDETRPKLSWLERRAPSLFKALFEDRRFREAWRKHVKAHSHLTD